MKTPFQKNLAWSAAIHVVALLVLALGLGFSHPDKPPETIQWVDIASLPGESIPAPPENPLPPSPPVAPPAPGPVSPPTEVSPPEPKPPIEEPPIALPPEPKPPEPIVHEPEPVPEPKPAPKEVAKPKPIPKAAEPKPAPNPAQPPTPKIKISKTRVVHTVGGSSAGASSAKAAPSSARTTNSVSPSFGKTLLAKLGKNGSLITEVGATGGGASNNGVESKDSWYKNLIQQELYGAWQPPLGMDEGMGAKVLLRIEKNGVISKVSLAASSGNIALDKSALEAPNRVKKLPPLPEGMGSPNPYAEVIVFFKIQKS